MNETPKPEADRPRAAQSSNDARTDERDARDREKAALDEALDEALKETFPASDPISISIAVPRRTRRRQ